MQKSRKALRKEEDKRREAVFEDGEVFEGEAEEKEIVVTEMDATMLYSQEKGAKEAYREARYHVLREGAGKRDGQIQTVSA